MLDDAPAPGASAPGGKLTGGAESAQAVLGPGLARLYASPLPASRKGALYNAFSYPTKISPETIAVFLAAHTKPGETVLDTFGGSGTTGIAALLCDKPTDLMKQMAADAGVNPVWGPRHAIVQDIGVLGSFVAGTLCAPRDPAAFEAAAAALIDKVEGELPDLYSAQAPDGQPGTVRHVIWTDFLSCDQCEQETSFWDAAVRFEPLRLLDTFVCPHCGHESPMETTSRATDVELDPILKREVVTRKRRPVRVHGKTGKKNWQREATDDDIRRCADVDFGNLPRSAPVTELAWGELHRAGYHTGISHLHHFYTRRNFLAMARLWEAIEEFPEDMRQPLRFLVLSYNGPHATLMTRVVVKTGQRDFVLTGAQSGVLYVSGLPVEKNIFEGLRRKTKTIRDAFTMTQGSASTVRVVQGSSTHLELPDGSVDYVFTDPPFGDYIPYAEVNQISEAWLGTTTDRAAEIVVSGSGGKSVETYGRMMAEVFAEVARVLKPDGRATVVFHSAKADVWKVLSQAYSAAGLGVEATSVLDKVQDSFKQVVSTVSVKGDPLLLLRKSRVDALEPSAGGAILQSILQEAEQLGADGASRETSPERLFSVLVGRCLAAGVPVPMNADGFYAEVRRRRSAA